MTISLPAAWICERFDIGLLGFNGTPVPKYTYENQNKHQFHLIWENSSLRSFIHFQGALEIGVSIHRPKVKSVLIASIVLPLLALHVFDKANPGGTSFFY